MVCEVGNIRKRKSKIIAAVPKRGTRSKIARKRKERSPRPVNLAQSHNGSLESLDEDANRNWSNEHGNLSPKLATTYRPTSSGNLHRLSVIAKVLDSDSNRSWSNEHGNLSPESLSPNESSSSNRVFASDTASSPTSIFTPSSTASASSSRSKLHKTPATTSTFASRDGRRYTPVTATTASTSGSVSTPSETDRISYEEFLRSSATSSRSWVIPTPLNTLNPGQFDLANYLRHDDDGYFGSFAPFSPTTSDTGSNVTAIYTPAITNSMTSGSNSDTSAVKYTPNSTTTSGSTVVYTPASIGTPPNRANGQLSKSSIFAKRDALALFPDSKKAPRPGLGHMSSEPGVIGRQSKEWRRRKMCVVVEMMRTGRNLAVYDDIERTVET